MKIQTNCHEIYLRLPLGCMIFDRVMFAENEKVETVFFIKDKLKYFETLGKFPKIEVRSGIIGNQNVLLLPVLLQFNFNPDMIYESWFNYCHHEVFNSFVDLSLQNEIRLVLIDEFCSIHRVLKVKNGVWPSFQQILKAMKNHKGWSMCQFDISKMETCREYPTSNDLWEKLGRKDGDCLRVVLD